MRTKDTRDPGRTHVVVTDVLDRDLDADPAGVVPPPPDETPTMIAHTPAKSARIDFHIHSRASNVTDYYTSNALSIPESYSDPVATYHNLRAAGMDLVTLTDHNSIDGVLELLDRGLPDVFISSEMTTTFPEDGCNIHVTVANMTEAQFREVERLRGNVYEMVAYVDEQIAAERPGDNRLAYFMTHPLMSTQNRQYGREGSLTIEHIEKALLLCNAIEVRNGTRARSFNELTAQVVASLTPARIEQLADKHGLEPKGDTPWIKAVLSGSDDHSGINQGQTWTEFRYHGERPTVDDLLDSIRQRRTRAGGEHGGPVTLAHAVVKLLFDAQHQDEGGGVAIGGPLNVLLHEAFGAMDTLPLGRRLALRLRAAGTLLAERWDALTRRDPTFERTLLVQSRGLLQDADFRRRLEAAEGTDERIHLIISTLLNRIFVHYVDRIRSVDALDLFRTIKESIALVSSHVFVSLPYFLCYSTQSADKLLLRDARRAFDLHERERLLLVTDTLFEVNGVSRTIRRFIDAAEQRGVDLTVATCLRDDERDEHLADPQIARLVDEGRLVIFPSLTNLDVPEYAGLQLRFPPFLEFLKFAQDEGFTKFQLSTPGPCGIAGLIAAKILAVETSSTYHTSFPEYVEELTGDISLEAFTWKAMLAFYHAVDEVVVPSRYIAKLLHRRGLRKRNLLVLDRWVDLERFDPRHRSDDVWRGHGLTVDPERVVFAYVGRVSREKNLGDLVEAFTRVSERHPRAHLAVIGDGPYRAEMERALAGRPVTFTGFLEGEQLARTLASADAKVFPSTTDTWGNAPLEAQASGLPVVVTDMGGPQELMQDGVTGFRVRGGDVDALAGAMERLMDDGTRRAMGVAARDFAEAGHVDDPYTAVLDAREYRRRRGKQDERAKSDRVPRVLDEDFDVEQLLVGGDG